VHARLVFRPGAENSNTETGCANTPVGVGKAVTAGLGFAKFMLVAGLPICDEAWRQRRQAPAPFNELRYRCVIEQRVSHLRDARIRVQRERRNDDRGNPKSQQNLPADLIGVDIVCRDDTGRGDMFEESAPLIESDDQPTELNPKAVPVGSRVSPLRSDPAACSVETLQ
jgi:hypothetical protein